MPTYENPAADADEVHSALRALAHATRSVDDPRQIYSVLGWPTSAVASLSQSLHQLAHLHDAPDLWSVWLVGDPHAERAAAYRVSWELHRSAEILNEVSESNGHAHSAETTIRHVHRDFTSQVDAPLRAVDRGLGL